MMGPRSAVAILAAGGVLLCAAPGKGRTATAQPSDVLPHRSWGANWSEPWSEPSEETVRPVTPPPSEQGWSLRPAPVQTQRETVRFPGETAAFVVGWEAALDAARRGDAPGCRAVLDGLVPATREGDLQVRRLLFAVLVAEDDRAGADSLFYRLTWTDRGRTAGRLSAWRSLEGVDAEGVRRALESGYELAPGEHAALAWAAWTSAPEQPDVSLAAAPPDATGPGPAFLALAEARTALLQGDRPTAEAALARADAAGVPAAWSATAAGLARALEGSGGPAEATPDGAALRQVMDLHVAGDLAGARRALDAWLGTYTQSPYRATAYLESALLHLAMGNPSAAQGDLQPASRRGGPETQLDRDLARAFLLSQEGRHDDARGLLERLLASPAGARRAPELLFDRSRLEKAAGDEEAAVNTILLLEEGYPDAPWYARARDDRDPTAWRAPAARVLPLPEGQAPVVQAPLAGPWGPMLFGEAYLPETAAGLDLETAATGPAIAAQSSIPEMTNEPVAELAPTRRAPDSWRATLGAGVGSRLTGTVGGSMSGSLRGLAYRLRADWLRTEEPDELPTSKRAALEAGLAGTRKDWRWSLDVSGLGRTEDPIDEPGLSLGQVKADGWGASLDLRRDLAAPGLSRGDVTWNTSDLRVDGRGDWRIRELGLSLDARRRMWGGLWDARLGLTLQDLEQPGYSGTVLYPDLRLVRRFGGSTYLGGRAAVHRGQALLLPVAGAEASLPGHFRVWAASEPSLELTPFRETFLLGGDWNVPDFELAVQRRWLDLRGGFRWEPGAGTAEARMEYFHADDYRTWRSDGGLWVESAVGAVRGTRLHLRGVAEDVFGARLVAEGNRLWLRDNDGDAVPFVPDLTGRLGAEYDWQRWTFGTSFLAVRGRHDEGEAEFGSFLRWDVEARYRTRSRLEYSLRIENLGNAAAKRWPGYPVYGRGIYGGVRLLLGS